MMKIYTKTGDDGTTGIYGSELRRLKKYDILIETIGTIDELNSHMGLIFHDEKPFSSSKQMHLIFVKL